MQSLTRPTAPSVFLVPFPSSSSSSSSSSFQQWKKKKYIKFRPLQINNVKFVGSSDGNGRLDLALVSTRKLFDKLPEPAKIFPWKDSAIHFFTIILGLIVSVAKYLCIPLLAVSSLSEMSYCAHERKMVVIPLPFLAGIAVAGVLKYTALELSAGLKEAQFPWHLLLMAIFFVLLKLPGPYYPYMGRLLLPHFANGGLWRTLWFFIDWQRKASKVLDVGEDPTAHQNQSDE